ncbi:unnamed protein product, partial [marine sediment metagenome]
VVFVARLIPSSLLIGLRGSIGAQSFSVWRKSIYYVKTKVDHISQPDTVAQQSVRNKLRSMVIWWKNALTQAQRDEWGTFAKSRRDLDNQAGGMRQIIQGNSRPGTGYHSFIELGMNKATAGFVPAIPLSDPPFDEIPPDGINALFASYRGAPNDDMIVEWVEPDTYPPDSRLRLWIRSPNNIYHRQISETPAIADETDTIIGAQSVGGATVLFSALAHNMPIYLQADVIAPSGQLSSPSNTVVRVTEA